MECHVPGCNMGEVPRRQALRSSVVVFAVTLAIGVVLAQLGTSWAWRMPLVVPFFFGVYGAMMALTGTCGFMAARGLRDLGDGTERVLDRDELSRARQTGYRVIASGAATAIALTVGLTAV